MESERQRALAVWSVLVVPFVALAVFLWTQHDLTLGFVGAYWFAPVVLTIVGVLPAPWGALRK
ncbi:hypothetical protein B4589_006645 [Halolamina sp. CBA1230]|uniref:hypothetical protein n=1 Tax=Halolamina sp. CBA1230 TaxID=1853690 RepID=UPI0009A20529|nr:hypothetical protein [Halolamina sp. CBA1230]QKY20071.1 hypothetical protein B4589_006645 [Halolamina sp. CBA1230]